MTDASQPEGPQHAAEAGAAKDPLVGKILADRFRMIALVARGGMGKIYRAEQAPLGRQVAIKVLDPNTVRIYDYGQTWDDVFFIAMEFLEGRTLQKLLKGEGPLDARRLIHMVRQICGSLAEAHDAGLIHRDLKPSNVMLTNSGDDPDFVKVLDFGLVKNVEENLEVTRENHMLGSPLYMSPEQVQGTDLDARSDIYALGVILYLGLTGQQPFQRANSAITLLSQINDPAPPFRTSAPEVKITSALEWVTLTCLSKSRDDRFRDVRELVRALRICDLELSGAIQGPLHLRLDEGRLVVPAEVEDQLTGTSGGRRVSLPTLDQPRNHAFSDPNTGTNSSGMRAGFGWILPAAIVFVVASAAALALVAVIGVAAGVWGISNVPGNAIPFEPAPAGAKAVLPVEAPAQPTERTETPATTSTPPVETTTAAPTEPVPSTTRTTTKKTSGTSSTSTTPAATTPATTTTTPAETPSTQSQSAEGIEKIKEVRDPWEEEGQ